MAKPTTTATQDRAVSDQPRQRQDVAVLQPARLPYHPIYQERYGIDGMMWRALVEAVYPSAKTVEGVILAVSYCRSKNYDVMKKMVHVVPIWNSALKKEVEGVWEAVSALRATAFRTGEYAGCDETKFGPTKRFHFDDEVGFGEKAKRIQMDVDMPEWAQVTVYRLVAGVRCAFPGPKVTYLGAYGCRGKSEIPNEKWSVSGDSYMLEKCAEAAALRKAFPEELGGMNAAEEMEGRKVDLPAGPTIDHEPTPPPRPTRESVRREEARQGSYEMDRQFRDTMRETPTHDNTTGEVKETGDAAETQEREPAWQDSGQQASSDAHVENGAQGGQEPQAAREQPKPQPVAEKAKPTPAPQQERQPQERQEPTSGPVNFTKLANEVIKKVMSASAVSTIKAIEEAYDDDLTAMATKAPADYKRVEDAIGGKRAKLSQA